MPDKILHNSFGQSKEYLENLEILFSDYGNVRKKIFSERCLAHLREDHPAAELLLTHSATGALEMVSLLLDLQPGDEIIMPSFTFVATAQPFVLRGAVPVFVDIDPVTLNMDPRLAEEAVTPRTKAVVCMHYGGFAADVSALRALCDRKGIPLVEDAAMGYGASHDGKPLGSFGNFAVISFDITKHISAMQGGLLIINDPKYAARARHIYHVGTNRSEFMDGKTPYFEWVDLGSKFQMPEICAAVLDVQLRNRKSLLSARNAVAETYYRALKPLADAGKFAMMDADRARCAVHLFYLLLPDQTERDALMEFMENEGVECLFHYIPLHSSRYGRSRARFAGSDTHTTRTSARLLRLPLHADLSPEDTARVCGLIHQFYTTC